MGDFVRSFLSKIGLWDPGSGDPGSGDLEIDFWIHCTFGPFAQAWSCLGSLGATFQSLYLRTFCQGIVLSRVFGRNISDPEKGLLDPLYLRTF